MAMASITDTTTECDATTHGGVCDSVDTLQSMPYGKTIGNSSYIGKFERRSEHCEGEIDLDPFSENARVFGIGTKPHDMSVSAAKRHRSKKRFKNRNPSLIDKALKLQQTQKFQDPQQHCEPEPVQILFGDLQADWSRYTKRSGALKLDSTSMKNAHTQSTTIQPLATATSSRILRTNKQQLQP
jgi:hypothetical protein